MTVTDMYKAIKKGDGWALWISDESGLVIAYCNSVYLWEDIPDAIKCMEVEEISPGPGFLFLRVVYPVENIHETEDEYISEGYEKIFTKSYFFEPGERTIYAKKLLQPNPYTGGCEEVGYTYAIIDNCNQRRDDKMREKEISHS